MRADIAQHFLCFSRNGIWGTCKDCPIDKVMNIIVPEKCKNKDREDHKLGVDALAQLGKCPDTYYVDVHCSYDNEAVSRFHGTKQECDEFVSKYLPCYETTDRIYLKNAGGQVIEMFAGTGKEINGIHEVKLRKIGGVETLICKGTKKDCISFILKYRSTYTKEDKLILYGYGYGEPPSGYYCMAYDCGNIKQPFLYQEVIQPNDKWEIWLGSCVSLGDNKYTIGYNRVIFRGDTEKECRDFIAENQKLYLPTDFLVLFLNNEEVSRWIGSKTKKDNNWSVYQFPENLVDIKLVNLDTLKDYVLITTGTREHCQNYLDNCIVSRRTFIGLVDSCGNLIDIKDASCKKGVALPGHSVYVEKFEGMEFQYSCALAATKEECIKSIKADAKIKSLFESAQTESVRMYDPDGKLELLIDDVGQTEQTERGWYLHEIEEKYIALIGTNKGINDIVWITRYNDSKEKCLEYAKEHFKAITDKGNTFVLFDPDGNFVQIIKKEDIFELFGLYHVDGIHTSPDTVGDLKDTYVCAVSGKTEEEILEIIEPEKISYRKTEAMFSNKGKCVRVFNNPKVVQQKKDSLWYLYEINGLWPNDLKVFTLAEDKYTALNTKCSGSKEQCLEFARGCFEEIAAKGNTLVLSNPDKTLEVVEEDDIFNNPVVTAIVQKWSIYSIPDDLSVIPNASKLNKDSLVLSGTEDECKKYISDCDEKQRKSLALFDAEGEFVVEGEDIKEEITIIGKEFKLLKDIHGIWCDGNRPGNAGLILKDYLVKVVAANNETINIRCGTYPCLDVSFDDFLDATHEENKLMSKTSGGKRVLYSDIVYSVERGAIKIAKEKDAPHRHCVLIDNQLQFSGTLEGCADYLSARHGINPAGFKCPNAKSEVGKKYKVLFGPVNGAMPGEEYILSKIIHGKWKGKNGGYLPVGAQIKVPGEWRPGEWRPGEWRPGASKIIGYDIDNIVVINGELSSQEHLHVSEKDFLDCVDWRVVTQCESAEKGLEYIKLNLKSLILSSSYNCRLIDMDGKVIGEWDKHNLSALDGNLKPEPEDEPEDEYEWSVCHRDICTKILYAVIRNTKDECIKFINDKRKEYKDVEFPYVLQNPEGEVVDLENEDDEEILNNLLIGDDPGALDSLCWSIKNRMGQLVYSGYKDQCVKYLLVNSEFHDIYEDFQLFDSGDNVVSKKIVQGFIKDKLEKEYTGSGFGGFCLDHVIKADDLHSVCIMYKAPKDQLLSEIKKCDAAIYSSSLENCIKFVEKEPSYGKYTMAIFNSKKELVEIRRPGEKFLAVKSSKTSTKKKATKRRKKVALTQK